jgi:virginiamycin A acetyltransferase
MSYNEPRIFNELLIKLYRYDNKYIRKTIIAIMLRRKHSAFYSKALRKIFSIYHQVEIGLYSYGIFYANFPPGTKVGRYTSLARKLLIINGSHPVLHKSSHPFFFNPDLGYVEDLLIERRKRLIIGNDVYIGLGVTILPGVVSIGNGSVIAAGSVVTKDVPSFAIIGGNPAKLIKYRFSKKIIEKINNSKWWEKNIEELKANENEFLDFLKKME